jgi:hypothetical protein
MKWDSLSRRHFLHCAGAALALPMLPSLLPRKAWAQAAPVQKSFVAMAAYNGLYRALGPKSQLMPQLPFDIRSSAGFTSLAPTGLHTVYSAPLANVTTGGRISDIIDASFNPMLPKMLMMQGFDYLAVAGHHHAHFGDQAEGPTATPAQATLDQVMANSTHFYKNPALKGTSLVFTANNGETGLSPGGYGVSATYQNPGSPNSSPIIATPPFFNPQAVWDKFFGSSQNTGPSLKTTLVDRTLADYKAVRNGPRISAADRQILDQHVAFLQSAEQQVQMTSGCTPGTRPADNAPSGAPWGAGLYGFNTQDTEADRVALLQTMNTVITALIACGLCNSFLGSTCSLTSVSPEDWHHWSHAGYDNDTDTIPDPISYNSLINDNRHVMKDICLDLALKLDAIKPDGVHSLLDNSLIMCVQEHSKRGHEAWNVPVITFGSAGGVLKTGQYLDYRNFGSGRDDQIYTRLGFPINQLWANALQACGVPPSEYEALNSVADPNFQIGNRLTGYGSSNFCGDNAWYLTDSYQSGWAGHDLSAWLPFIT